MAVTVAHWAAAVLYNGLGRHEEAAAAARQVDREGRPTLAVDVGAVRSSSRPPRAPATPELARDALDALAETTQPAGNDFALGIEARSRALLGDGAAAEALYREAIERLSRTRLRPELARAHLLFGEWLRREGRLGEARERLRTAEEMFAAIGMEAFAERARGELAARRREAARAARSSRARSSRRRRSRSPGSPATGSRNAEIGAQLFLSPRTVEWHLHKVFGKLGIDSRKRPATPRLPDRA